MKKIVHMTSATILYTLTSIKRYCLLLKRVKVAEGGNLELDFFEKFNLGWA